MISSVDVARSYTEFTSDNSILFYRENSSSPTGSNIEPQNNHYVCRGMTQKWQKKEEREKDSNTQMKEGRKKLKKKNT
jgi:hypothetical protein